ncbi:hypothetical protein BD779DRAFT_1507923 [Infundibulicybe gibba]|nr:hypothetical protein BD779DRAFT_1507923 [Infundibulicybe gibba]
MGEVVTCRAAQTGSLSAWPIARYWLGNTSKLRGYSWRTMGELKTAVFPPIRLSYYRLLTLQ